MPVFEIQDKFNDQNKYIIIPVDRNSSYNMAVFHLEKQVVSEVRNCEDNISGIGLIFAHRWYFKGFWEIDSVLEDPAFGETITHDKYDFPKFVRNQRNKNVEFREIIKRIIK